MGVHVAVPVAPSGPERDRLHRWVIAEWLRYRDRLGWTVCYAADRAIREEGETRTTDEFNHAKAINNAVRAFGAFDGRDDDVLLIADADTFPTPESLLPRILAAREGRWSCPDRYVNLNATTTDRILEDTVGFEEGTTVAEMARSYEWQGGASWAGVVVIRRDQFEAVGGYDERFDGWSADDVAFAMTVETLVRPVTRMGTVYHLWHPAPRDRTYEREGFSKSWALTQRYIDAHGNATKTRRIIEERP